MARVNIGSKINITLKKGAIFGVVVTGVAWGRLGYEGFEDFIIFGRNSERSDIEVHGSDIVKIAEIRKEPSKIMRFIYGLLPDVRRYTK